MQDLQGREGVVSKFDNQLNFNSFMPFFFTSSGFDVRKRPKNIRSNVDKIHVFERFFFHF